MVLLGFPKAAEMLPAIIPSDFMKTKMVSNLTSQLLLRSITTYILSFMLPVVRRGTKKGNEDDDGIAMAVAS